MLSNKSSAAYITNSSVCFYIFLFVLCGITSNTIHAQIKGEISGIVISQQDKLPVSSATVTLRSSSDSSIITGFITQKKRQFFFKYHRR